jgi:hypothetical protein
MGEECGSDHMFEWKHWRKELVRIALDRFCVICGEDAALDSAAEDNDIDDTDDHRDDSLSLTLIILKKFMAILNDKCVILVS